MFLSKDKKTGLYYRPWTNDLDTIRRAHREYESSLPRFDSTDSVLDLGVNIGAFSHLIADIVLETLGFEPVKENYQIARKNLPDHVKLQNAAIVENDDKVRDFYMTGKSQASGSLWRTRRMRSFKVGCENFYQVLDDFEPTIIKCDTEGQEHFILHRPLPEYVRGLIVEIHLGNQQFRTSAEQLVVKFKQQGFKFLEPVKYTDQSWAFVVNAWR